MKYRPKNFNIKIGLVILLVITMWLLAGCNSFEEKITKYQSNVIKCYPEDSNMCAGWLGNKPIDLKEEL